MAPLGQGIPKAIAFAYANYMQLNPWDVDC